MSRFSTHTLFIPTKTQPTRFVLDNKALDNLEKNLNSKWAAENNNELFRFMILVREKTKQVIEITFSKKESNPDFKSELMDVKKVTDFLNFQLQMVAGTDKAKITQENQSITFGIENIEQYKVFTQPPHRKVCEPEIDPVDIKLLPQNDMSTLLALEETLQKEWAKTYRCQTFRIDMVFKEDKSKISITILKRNADLTGFVEPKLGKKEGEYLFGRDQVNIAEVRKFLNFRLGKCASAPESVLNFDKDAEEKGLRFTIHDVKQYQAFQFREKKPMFRRIQEGNQIVIQPFIRQKILENIKTRLSHHKPFNDFEINVSEDEKQACLIIAISTRGNPPQLNYVQIEKQGQDRPFLIGHHKRSLLELTTLIRNQLGGKEGLKDEVIKWQIVDNPNPQLEFYVTDINRYVFETKADFVVRRWAAYYEIDLKNLVYNIHYQQHFGRLVIQDMPHSYAQQIENLKAEISQIQQQRKTPGLFTKYSDNWWIQGGQHTFIMNFSQDEVELLYDEWIQHHPDYQAMLKSKSNPKSDMKEEQISSLSLQA